MKELKNEIIETYLKIKKMDSTIPDRALNFMFETSMSKVHEIEKQKEKFLKHNNYEKTN